MRFTILGLLALAIGPAAATDGLDFEIFFTGDGSPAAVHCGGDSIQAFNETVTNNGCESWRFAYGDAVRLVSGQAIPASLQTNDEQTCTVYWVQEINGVNSQTCADTVLTTTAELTDECYVAPVGVYGLNVVCEQN
ncbi:hypothetical protein TGAM01_v206320 [Trichoderma gamsii]|uniref:Secreted protein n=1 Tax=Trichoderma gamsii TaxID=398673 RepID=A0A2P4ZKJ7_9HYPO|nr:hypothetical protein TGAM01_v206320 [Trichoderma gamsii]PON24812.1 hypothetical protein TGAM01_v206320 [Trichoderma gamsii]